MSLGVGIVGLPNVGKSTLFNALTQEQNAEAANYPFCTIEPNKAVVVLRDLRVDELAKIARSKKITYATVEFVDIAGLVRGASRGEGLGNKFLANIREVDAILHVVRCFADDDVVHVEGDIDPVRDIGIIETELVLADIQTLERRLDRVGRQARADKELRAEVAAIEALMAHLDSCLPARTCPRKADDAVNIVFNELQLLSNKRVIYCANIDEDDTTGDNEAVAAVKAHAATVGAPVVVISARMEAELAGLSESERADFLTSYGLSESGLDQTVREAYHSLGLGSFFTAGPTEARAWTFRRGCVAPQAAGVIHSDFERGFIRAEVIGMEDYIRLGGETACRSAGLMHLEGKEYEVNDGDVIHFLFNV